MRTKINKKINFNGETENGTPSFGKFISIYQPNGFYDNVGAAKCDTRNDVLDC